MLRVAELASAIERDEAALMATATADETAGNRTRELAAQIDNFGKTKDAQVKAIKRDIAAAKKTQADLNSKV